MESNHIEGITLKKVIKRIPRKEKKEFYKWVKGIKSITGQGLTYPLVMTLLFGMYKKRHTMNVLHHSK